jgi:hypothetical protein
MAGYTKEFLVDAFLSRYIDIDPKSLESLAAMANNFYDTEGRDRFRVYCSLDAEALRVYKNWLAG